MDPTSRRSDLSDRTEEPIQAYRRTVTPAYKKLIYWFVRPLLDRQVRKVLSSDAAALPALRMVLPERGFPMETRRAWINRLARIRGKHVLVQGTGTGWDVLTWLPKWPGRITGVDTFPFSRSWGVVQAHARALGAAVPCFAVSSLEALPLRAESVDLAASDAVFEHCRDLKAVLAETFRVLRPGGYVYATYGPLWFCFGGDHFSGRGGLTHGYNHVELEASAYRAYFMSHRIKNGDAQSGDRYVEIDLFAKLTTRQYLECFRVVGFDLVELIIEVSQNAIEFRRRWPKRFEAIVSSRSGLTADDLLIKSNFVILRRPAGGEQRRTYDPGSEGVLVRKDVLE